MHCGKGGCYNILPAGGMLVRGKGRGDERGRA